MGKVKEKLKYFFAVLTDEIVNSFAEFPKANLPDFWAWWWTLAPERRI
jgi:hypothetical protein